MGGGEVGVECEGVAEEGFGWGGLVKGGEDVSEVGPGDGVVLPGGESSLSHVQSGLELAALAGNEAESEQGGLGSGICGKMAAVGLCGGEKLTVVVVVTGGF